MTRAQYVQVD